MMRFKLPVKQACRSVLLGLILLLLAAQMRPTCAQVADPEPIGASEADEKVLIGLFLGASFGGGTWQIPGKTDLLPIDFDGLHASGYFQTSGLYAHGNLRYDTLVVRGPGKKFPSFPRIRVKGRFLASTLRTKIGGLATGLYTRYNRNNLDSPYGVSYITEEKNAVRGTSLKETVALGALLGLHSPLDSRARLVIMGGPVVEHQTTQLDLPIPQILGGSMLGVDAQFPIGTSLQAHLRGDAGAWFWSSPYTEAGATGELVKGLWWDATARLSATPLGGLGIYGGITISGREGVVRFRESPREADASEAFMSTLSGKIGIVLRD